MNLMTIMVAGGAVVGVQKRSPNVAHAITTETFIDAELGKYQPTAPCGAKHLRFLTDKDRRGVIVWPIRAEGEMTRCRECWVATGKKRPAKARDGGPS